jgi:hypothetical protein
MIQLNHKIPLFPRTFEKMKLITLKMGASTSKNISHSVTHAIAKVSSDIIQNTKLSLDQAQIISVQDIEGDVIISGDVFTQKATINMKSLLDALSKEENQQKILMELAQESKSITSGLNLAQYSNAQNIMNTLIEATVSMLSTISQTCTVFSKQFQNIDISRVKGSVRIENNVFDQMYDLLQNCSEKAVSENRSIQDLVSQLDQKASATSEGLSGTFLVLIAAVIIGLPVIGGTVLGVTFLKIIFPIFIVVGILLISFYVYKTDEEMKMIGFSSFISENPVCSPTPVVIPVVTTNSPFYYSSSAYENATTAALACKQNPKCVAFDWRGLDISKVGIGTPVKPPSTTFYSGVSTECQRSIKPDNIHLLSSPAAFSGTLKPTTETVNGKIGDIYLDTTTSNWYQRSDDWPTGWKPMGTIASHPYSKISWGSNNPLVSNITGNAEELYIYFNETNPIYFHVFKYDNEHGWLEERKIRGPGLIASTPDIINTSGFKEIKRKQWVLYSGIGCLTIGVIGILYTTLSKKEHYEGCGSFPFSFKDK